MTQLYIYVQRKKALKSPKHKRIIDKFFSVQYTLTCGRFSLLFAEDGNETCPAL